VRSRVELFEQIRKDSRVEGASIRALADRHRVHRHTVRQALESAVPPARKPYSQRPRPAIGAYAERPAPGQSGRAETQDSLPGTITEDPSQDRQLAAPA